MHHDLKTILKDDNTTESVSQDQLRKRGVDALSDSPKNRLKNNPPGSSGRRQVYKDLNWKNDKTIPQNFGEKVRSFATKASNYLNKNKANITMGLLGLPVGPSILSKMKLKKEK